MSIITWLTFQSILKLQNFFQMKDLGLHKNQQIMMMIIIACYHEFDLKNWRKFKLKFEYILKKNIHPPTHTNTPINQTDIFGKKKIDHDQKKRVMNVETKKKIEIKSYRLMKTKRKRKIWLTFSTDEKKNEDVVNQFCFCSYFFFLHCPFVIIYLI